ncbi:MAG: DNA-processing protein DprA [Halioglobus sp.]
MNVAKENVGTEPLGSTVLAIDDPDYPPLLREIRDPPPLLYIEGDPALLQQPQLAVVGSRRASPGGLRLAELLSGQLASTGLHICSGLALGIDGAAHRGALAVGGKSVAVLATGIDRVYPRRHRGLARELAQTGCLVTEFAPGTPPLRHNFPRRNRIISGLSLGVLVVEAALPSGSLITAATAVEQGREVFALPWSMLHAGGSGCLQLIRDGAKMVRELEDILEELGPLYIKQQECSSGVVPNIQRPTNDSWLLPLIGFEKVSLDELVQLSGRPVSQVLGELSGLELSGQVILIAGGYIRC